MSMRTIAVAPVKKTIHVAAPQAHAFDVFTKRIGAWWPKTHHIAKVDMADSIIEARAGGRWYEVGVDASQTDWGKVLVWEPPSHVALSWRLNSKFEIDETVESRVDVHFFAEGANATRVELEHRIKAADASEIQAAVESPRGWSMLLGLYADTARES